jgi:hypothetical protein
MIEKRTQKKVHNRIRDGLIALRSSLQRETTTA